MPAIIRPEMRPRDYIRDVVYADSVTGRLSVLAIATVVLLIRKTDLLVHPQFWAEDGTIFFLQQYERGISAIVQPYAGYLHLVPRLVAAIADTCLPYSLIPHAYTFLSLAISLFVVSAIFSRRFNVRYKGLFALALVLIPHYGNEVFLNVTNIQWFLAVLLIITALSEEPDIAYGNRRAQLVSDMIRISLCGLTGPFLILFAPLFAWNWFRKKSKYHSIMALAVGSILAIQLSVISIQAVELRSSYVNLDLHPYSMIIGRKTFGALFLGGLANSLNPFFLTAIYLSLLIALLWQAKHKRKFVLFFLYAQAVVLLATFLRFKATPEVLIPAQNGVRYFYLPVLMTTWSLLIVLEEVRSWRRTVAIMALVCIGFSALTSKFRSSLIDYSWSLHSKSIGIKDIVIPINPQGWSMHIKPRQRSLFSKQGSAPGGDSSTLRDRR